MKHVTSVNRPGRIPDPSSHDNFFGPPGVAEIAQDPAADYLSYFTAIISSRAGAMEWIKPGEVGAPESEFNLLIMGVPDTSHPTTCISALFVAELMGMSKAFTLGDNSNVRTVYVRLFLRPGQVGPYATMHQYGRYNVTISAVGDHPQSLVIRPSYDAMVLAPGEPSVPIRWQDDLEEIAAVGIIPSNEPGVPEERYYYTLWDMGFANLSVGRASVVMDPVGNVFVEGVASPSNFSFRTPILSPVASMGLESGTTHVWVSLSKMANESRVSITLLKDADVTAPDFSIVAAANETISPFNSSVYYTKQA